MAALPSAAQDLASAPKSTDLPARSQLQARLHEAMKHACEKFADRKLTTNQLAATVIDLTNPDSQIQASFRGDVQIYPASVVKLFYLAAAHHWMQQGIIEDTAELQRAMRDMIVESNNEATHYIVDVLTETTSGPELPSAELEQWYYRRNAVNRYFSALGYTNINVNRKPWCEGPYGREIQSVKIHQPNHRNWLTTDSTARLMTEIATGKATSPARSSQMMKLLERSPFGSTGSADGQSRAYTGLALSPGDKLWSKAGWTSQSRHDAAYVELNDGRKFVFVIFTTDHAAEREIIPTLVRTIIERPVRTSPPK
jgi:hypothetical protein